jgi:hypothetical protein
MCAAAKAAADLARDRMYPIRCAPVLPLIHVQTLITLVHLPFLLLPILHFPTLLSRRTISHSHRALMKIASV